MSSPDNAQIIRQDSSVEVKVESGNASLAPVTKLDGETEARSIQDRNVALPDRLQPERKKLGVPTEAPAEPGELEIPPEEPSQPVRELTDEELHEELLRPPPRRTLSFIKPTRPENRPPVNPFLGVGERLEKIQRKNAEIRRQIEKKG
jgi:hypothetical protein